ncbi:MAG: thiazole synthase [bacterium]
MEDQPLKLGNREFKSRLICGTGKYATMELMAEALEASGCEIVTVALRRIDFSKPGQKTLLDYLDTTKYTLLPNTAGCYTKDEAKKICYLARELEIGDMVKLEVLGSPKTLLPDAEATLEGTKELVAEGFKVLAYTTDDPIMAKKLADAGATSVMPLGSPIGSGQGILNPNNIRLILEEATVPIIVDAGVGVASDVSFAMELGCHGVLLNTAIAGAKDPVKMAHSMRLATQAGRLSFLAGRIPKKRYATASSPILDF